MSHVQSSASEVVWNLDDLFSGVDDPRVEIVLNRTKKRAEEFQSTYRGKIDSPDLTAQTLLAALRELESIALESAKPQVFASLSFSADASNTVVQAFMQKVMERNTEISVPLIFFDLELAKAQQSVIEPLLQNPDIAPYRHHIETVRVYREHMLSEPEEKMLEETATTGPRAFRRLFEQITATQKFTMNGQELTQSEVLAKLYTADRAERKAAAEAFAAGLQAALPTVVFVSNTLMQDKSVRDRLRRYSYPEQSRHMSNELSEETVELVATTCEKNYDLVSRYYSIKREILGLDKLEQFDRYAPLFETDRTVSWSDAKDLVLSSFREFSPEMAGAASEFFDERWIDAAPRPGKRGGAFCAYGTPDMHPYVFLSYLERGRDVMTLAHELGHGVHSSLARVQSYFNYHGTLPMAELASTFGEMLVFENIQKRVDAKERLGLLAGKIEDSIATIFRQATMYRFEQRIHKHRREQGELSAEQFGQYWLAAIRAMFGDSVEIGDDHSVWWSYVGHFIGSPFYVYAYSFGELLALSLFQKSKVGGPEFVGRYLDLLRAGGSLAPQQLMDKVGVSLEDPQFWAGGADFVRREIDEFEAAWQEYRAGGGARHTA